MATARCIGIKDLFTKDNGLKVCNMEKARFGKIIDLFKREYSKMAN
jgi:hypothetical protein